MVGFIRQISPSSSQSLNHEKLVAFAVTVAHHGDVGGRLPGDNGHRQHNDLPRGAPDALAPSLRRGEPVRELFRVIQADVRIPGMTLGDLSAQVFGLPDRWTGCAIDTHAIRTANCSRSSRRSRSTARCSSGARSSHGPTERLRASTTWIPMDSPSGLSRYASS